MMTYSLAFKRATKHRKKKKGKKKKRSYRRRKVAFVMREFYDGNLRSSSGEPVTDPKQAMAISFSEASRS